MRRALRLLALLVILGTARELPSQGFPHTLPGCQAAAADQLIDCVDWDVYDDWMCVDTYDIVMNLCSIQYAE